MTKQKPAKIKRLFVDIETSPNVALIWESGYDIQVNYDAIIRERTIICIGYKWAGDKNVNILKWNHNQNDYDMLEAFIPILDKADEIVAHNGIDFDLKWIRTRCLKHNISMMPNYTVLDTIKLARSRFKFNSNALDYLSRYLDIGKKIETKYEMWKKILLENDQVELKKMISYCKHDVNLLEEVWNRLNPYVLASTNIAKFANHCPECGSSNVGINKRRITAAGYKKITFRCSDCGKYHTMAESKFMKGKQI